MKLLLMLYESDAGLELVGCGSVVRRVDTKRTRNARDWLGPWALRARRGEQARLSRAGLRPSLRCQPLPTHDSARGWPRSPKQLPQRIAAP